MKHSGNTASYDRGEILRMAEKYRSQRRIQKAVREYEKILSEDPRDIDVHIKIAPLYIRAGRKVQAKASLYRIYNMELRKDPTLRGKVLMRISIEPDGAVSLCRVEATELGSPELVDKIVERIRRFNFGSKEDVQRVTILYPIDFLPAG